MDTQYQKVSEVPAKVLNKQVAWIVQKFLCTLHITIWSIYCSVYSKVPPDTNLLHGWLKHQLMGLLWWCYTPLLPPFQLRNMSNQLLTRFCTMNNSYNFICIMALGIEVKTSEYLSLFCGCSFSNSVSVMSAQPTCNYNWETIYRPHVYKRILTDYSHIFLLSRLVHYSDTSGTSLTWMAEWHWNVS